MKKFILRQRFLDFTSSRISEDQVVTVLMSTKQTEVVDYLENKLNKLNSFSK